MAEGPLKDKVEHMMYDLEVREVINRRREVEGTSDFPSVPRDQVMRLIPEWGTLERQLRTAWVLQDLGNNLE